MIRNDDKAGKDEMAKLLDSMDPSDITPGFKPVPIECPECGGEMELRTKPWVGMLANEYSKVGNSTNVLVCKKCKFEKQA